MMKKRGQVTIFIIIAIIIVALTALFFVFKDRLGIFTPRPDPVYLFVKSCIEDTGADAIHYVTKNGGYLYPIALSTSGGLPYYLYNNKSYMPAKERIGEEISAYMEQTLPYCIDDFVDFPDLNITSGEINAKAIIKDEEVILNINYPLTIQKDRGIIRFSDFENIKVIARVGKLYDSIEKMIQEQAGQERICLSCMSSLAEAEGFTIGIITTDEGVIFSLRDEYSTIKDVPIEWKFINSY